MCSTRKPYLNYAHPRSIILPLLNQVHWECYDSACLGSKASFISIILSWFFSDTCVCNCCLLWNSEPERILILGLGAGILPRIFHQLSANTRIDVVEIDKTVLEIAEKYFRFSQTRAVRVYIEDGRNFLQRQPSHQDDVISVDAFTVNGRIPHVLRTIECLGEYRQTFARALFEQIYRVEVDYNYVLFGLHKQAQVFNGKDFEARARILEHSKPLLDFSWVQESQHFRNLSSDQWNASASIFTDTVYEDLQSTAESQYSSSDHLVFDGESLPSARYKLFWNKSRA